MSFRQWVWSWWSLEAPPQDDRSEEMPLPQPPPRKRVHPKSDANGVTAPPQRKRATTSVVALMPDVPDGKERIEPIPIDRQNAGTAHYENSTRAALHANGDTLHISYVPNGRRRRMHYTCRVLAEHEVRQHVARARRTIEVAIWEPELFWNARYYGCIGY